MSLSLPAFLQPLPPRYLGWMLEGFGMTLLVSAAAIAGGLALGLLLTALRASSQPWLTVPARGLVGFLRKTPLLVQLFFWYFGAAQLLGENVVGAITGWNGIALGGWRLPAPSFEFLAAAFGIALYAGAFFSEELRAGIRAVPRGQREAALSLGFTPRAAFLRVVLPQALRVSALPLLGQCANTIKNTSLAMGIGLAELSYSARQVETDTLLAFQAFAVATVLYAVVILLLQWAAPLVLRRLGWVAASAAGPIGAAA
ncbi:amino ABC transporter, permease, 3-TM region, His/Glu/Gln/Arg/opine family domain protein [Ralstonia insidiosa]|uniref:Amino ABC transporter, permease, 3-TM region, His/Glu/Gln/Arg/opine family domain protein n=3 Tax=Burkholderiaceae TaxID=119060 RepID=A0AAC9FUZ5_9RALS|nr:amino ABC transporter, permease, 3-TM region, His/Glu/Gln/Arg/opine family domain protein [Ralstonia insidiosa]EPX99449.1 amino acid ABC transporter permease [Ralstonia sp. AU12-08]GAQ29343.1 glutamate/aspartate transmembrane ABC transporter protein [Ralstonia sp. NT80]